MKHVTRPHTLHEDRVAVINSPVKSYVTLRVKGEEGLGSDFWEWIQRGSVTQSVMVSFISLFFLLHVPRPMLAAGYVPVNTTCLVKRYYSILELMKNHDNSIHTIHNLTRYPRVCARI